MLLEVDILNSSIDEEVAVDGSCRFPGHLDEYLIPVAASGSLLGGRRCDLEGECHHTRVPVRHTLVAAAAAAAAAAEKFGLLGKLGRRRGPEAVQHTPYRPQEPG